jgi:aspartyl-tRNA(Asn)/glutamyl-tRNA(Gln) amidotransferase subunit A
MRTHGLTPYDAVRPALFRGEITCEQIVGSALQSIDAGKHLNAFLTVFHQQSLERARNIDRRISEGKGGPLAGMIVAVKDILCMKGERVTCGSRMLESFVSPYDATVVRKLADADAIIIGKTNMDEFAMGSSSENSAFGPVLNPVDPSRVPGGSSSGSGVAVAAGMAHTSLGTDTGGSIRQPAAFCGIVGLKPTYGRVSRYGLVALSSSFDQVGPFATTIADAARVLSVISGHDECDATSAPVPVPAYEPALNAPAKGLRVGVPPEAFGEGLQPEIRAAVARGVETLKAEGATITEVHLPHSRYSLSTYYILMTAEASSNLARYDGARYGLRAAEAENLLDMYVNSRTAGFGAEVKRRIMLGTYVLSAGYYDAYYLKGQKVRRLIQNDFIEAFKHVDCLLMPTTPTTAFRFGEKVSDPLQMYLSDVYTVSANLAGVPALSVPFGRDDRGLPIGIQLLGNFFDESTILRVGFVLERHAPTAQS